jgi:hypothetical protein
MWLSVPVSIIDRDGEQVALAVKSVNRTPSDASSSRFGVSISPPKAPMSA